MALGATSSCSLPQGPQLACTSLVDVTHGAQCARSIMHRWKCAWQACKINRESIECKKVHV